MRPYLKLIFQVLVAMAVLPVHAGAYEDFFSALERDDPVTVQRLLQRGFDPNAVDAKGQPALTAALKLESNRVVEALVASPELRVDLANSAGETPLMIAALRGSLDWTRRLVERGAEVNRAGWTPLHYAASGPEPKVVAYLLDRGAAIDALSPNGTTALMMAARYGSLDAADLLLARKADAKLRNQRELGAVDFAKAAGRDALVAKLEQAAR